ncbi:MAG: membrane protein insertion efficiency factor YidD [Kiritimatiellia bacterium]
MRKALVDVLILCVRFYQGPLRGFLGTGPHCRYYPSCSQYMIEALQTHGPLRGLGLGLWRILRCNPFSNGGYDPVPQRRQPYKKDVDE